MLRGIHYGDVIKTTVGLAILATAMVIFGPGLLDRYDVTQHLSSTSSTTHSNPTAEHALALKIEKEHPNVDVLNIRTLDDRLVMTVLDVAKEQWSDEDLKQLIDVTFYLADLARPQELPVFIQMWGETEATTAESDTVQVLFHKESLVCAWHILERYDGTNAESLISNCLVHTGMWLELDAEDIAWVGRET
jgi:hypothetical protein